MSYMFDSAVSFNQDVSNFNASRVKYMYEMFQGATSFNQDLCSWRDSFLYNDADNINIYTNSNCTYQDTPQEDQKGPFCASDCQI